MSASTTASASQNIDIAATAFDDIVALEEKEEARVGKILSTLADEEREVRKKLDDKEQSEIRNAQEKADKDMKEFEAEGLKKVVATVEQDAEKEEHHAEGAYAKKSPAIVDTLVHCVLSLDF